MRQDDAETRCPLTPDHVEGPFYRPGAPERADLYPVDSRGPVLHFSGVVRNTECQTITGALLDVWQADDLGHYDNDDPNAPPPPDFFRCRGRLYTFENGGFVFRTVVPANYHPVPGDPWVRVKHIHFKVYASGYIPLTTEVALLPDDYAASDVLFNPALAAILASETDADQARERFKIAFDFILSPVSMLAYKTAAQRYTLLRK